MKYMKSNIVLDDREINDLLSALSFFRSDYGRKAPATFKAMAALEKKLWKLLRNIK